MYIDFRKYKVNIQQLLYRNTNVLFCIFNATVIDLLIYRETYNTILKRFITVASVLQILNKLNNISQLINVTKYKNVKILWQYICTHRQICSHISHIRHPMSKMWGHICGCVILTLNKRDIIIYYRLISINGTEHKNTFMTVQMYYSE